MTSNCWAPQEIADQSALAEYKTVYLELQQELQKAEDNNDLGKIERLTVQRDKLMERLDGIIRPGNKSKIFTDDKRRTRQAVSKAIKRALEYLKEAHPELHNHLQRSFRFDKYLIYDPPHPMIWHT